MKQQHIYAMGLLCSVAVMMVSAAPMPANNQELDVLQIPLSNGKELDVLTLGAKDEEQMIADRNKRTIGLLRELFPDITKEIDLQINRLVNEVLRQVGPAVLGTALNPALNPTNGGGKVRAGDTAADTDTEDGDADGVDDTTFSDFDIELATFVPDEEFRASEKQ